MKVAVVGAGISGLAAARSLKKAGHDPVLFEQASHVGGRCATESEGDYVFDSGASSIAPRGMSIQPVMLGEISSEGLVKVERPIYTHSGLRVSVGDLFKNKTPRYTYLAGNATLPERLAEGLDVRLDTQIERIDRTDSAYSIENETFDRVVLTPPAPQTTALLWTLSETRPLHNARYRCCLSLMLGFQIPPPDVPYHALLDPEQRHPLTWLSIESLKSPGRAPEGCCAMVVQLSPTYSLNRYDRPIEDIVGDVTDYLVRLYGDQWCKPVVSRLKRWKYSLPDTAALFDSVNPPESTLVVAGDGVLAGRVESAFESGVKAAAILGGTP